MSKYTIELRYLVDTFGEDVKNWFSSYELSDFLTAGQVEVINNAGFWSKEKLAQKIIEHYYMREIGLETPALFAHKAKVFMQEIMEEKAPLIYAKAILINPFVDTDITESFTGNAEGTTRGTSTNTGEGLTINSDTPQGQINKSEILQGKYASQTSANEGTSTTTDNGSTSSLNTYTKSIKGNQRKSPAELIAEYQNNIKAIDKSIIDAAGILFINIY